MTSRVAGLLDAYDEQCEALADRLAAVSPDAFAQPSALPGWDLRTLVGHVVASKAGMESQLRVPDPGPPVSAATYVQAYAPAAESITAATREATGTASPDELLERVRRPVDRPDPLVGRSVVAAPRGPLTAVDFVLLRLIDLVVHCDDVSRTLPDDVPVPLPRPALAATVRGLAEMLTERVPGRSVEVRIPPFVAVQAVPGPRHTRGTPPNVVETDAVTWLRLATGRRDFAEAVAGGEVRATGTRADLSGHLPLFR